MEIFTKYSFIGRSLFLDASSHLYIRGLMSVNRSVTIFFFFYFAEILHTYGNRKKIACGDGEKQYAQILSKGGLIVKIG